MTKTEAALSINIARLFEQGTPVLLTLTFEEVHEVKQAFYQWKLFQNALVAFGKLGKSNTIYGIRVAELHDGDESGHGVHYHVVLNRFVPIEIVRSIAEKFGFFWLEMKECYTAAGLSSYLAKYLSKQHRPECLKGKRLWSAFGKWHHSKVKNVRCLSEFSVAYRATYNLLRYQEMRDEKMMSFAHVGEGLVRPKMMSNWERHQYCVAQATGHLAAVMRGTRQPLTLNFIARKAGDVGWKNEHVQKYLLTPSRNLAKEAHAV